MLLEQKRLPEKHSVRPWWDLGETWLCILILYFSKFPNFSKFRSALFGSVASAKQSAERLCRAFILALFCTRRNLDPTEPTQKTTGSSISSTLVSDMRGRRISSELTVCLNSFSNSSVHPSLELPELGRSSAVTQIHPHRFIHVRAGVSPCISLHTGRLPFFIPSSSVVTGAESQVPSCKAYIWSGILSNALAGRLPAVNIWFKK